MNRIKENAKRKLKFQNSRGNKFFDEDSSNVTIKSMENTRDTFFHSGSSFQVSTTKFFYPQFPLVKQNTNTPITMQRKNSMHSPDVSRVTNTPERHSVLLNALNNKNISRERITHMPCASPSIMILKTGNNGRNSITRSKSVEKLSQLIL